MILPLYRARISGAVIKQGQKLRVLIVVFRTRS
uniref:Uncharacterized protein n=1 Tax=Siphoviridae sp. ct2ZW1 TaxID=2825316 RepID=A0A8S5Q8J9_9CAUD|nr:MAG TPA: hypothetical protein [Siphoviridae sp. ct2ZW1]